MRAVLRALQGGIESMYRVETDLDVCDFLLGGDRGGWEVERTPREQLLIKQGDGELELGLFVDERTLENLALRDPRRRLDEANLGDFLLAVEGVSHFVYLVHRARVERPVSAVELELQAEVDKYIVALLVIWNQMGEPPDDLRERLFKRVAFAGDLSREERERYQLANSAADEYAASLEARFVKPRALHDLLAEVRRFYRKGLAEKLALVAQLAA
ncbi:MAG TPA: hypothetical protein VFF06_18670 [Polyangia bacterium]|nr:hypothetical protein [Polyangia bacterium]